MSCFAATCGFILVFFNPATNSQSGGLRTGELIEKVTCQAQDDHSYALYLPTNYDPEKKWPVLFCFDPAARGSLPVTKFRRAAEFYGFILLGSNNSRNYVYNIAFEAINAMWQDANQHFAIDEGRVYLAGFSGGARSSCNIANLNRSVQGVIACGAGFGANYPPDPTRGFAFFGIVGDGDQNYLEMMQLDKTLDGFPHDHHIRVFEGTHIWPPDDVCFEGVAWLELQAIRKGLRNPWPEEVNRQFKKAQNLAQTLEAANQLDEAYRVYQALVDDFKDLVQLDAIQSKIKQLKADPRTKKALKEQRKRRHQEHRSMEVFRQRFSRLHRMTLKPSWVEKEKTWWQEQAELLNKKIKESQNQGEQLMAQRLLTLIRSTAFEETMWTLSQSDASRAVLAGEVAATLNPDNPVIYYNLACAHARRNDVKASIEALKEAVALGYQDAAFMQQDPDLAPLHHDVGFADLLKSLQKNPPPQ